MNLQELVEFYYSKGLNCSETILRAANDYYQLNIDEKDMKLVSGFGGGMFIGATCGALSASVCVISKLVIETKAHDQLNDFRPLIQTCTRNFKEELGAIDCKEIKPKYHTKDKKCIQTCIHAAIALEKTIYEYKMNV